MDVAGKHGEGVDASAAAAAPPFDAWYRTQYRQLVRVLAVVGGDREVALEAAAEAFARALVQWGRVATMASPSGWTYRVALNVLRRCQRLARIERLVPRHPPPPQAIPDDYVDLWEAVRSLPARQRTAIVLHYVVDLPQAEVASIMGVAPGTVAATLHAARHRLRTLLDLTCDKLVRTAWSRVSSNPLTWDQAKSLDV
jgi:RNA polymerase sigma factor (sigma-70 family)